MKSLIKILQIGINENHNLKIEDALKNMEYHTISSLENTDNAWFEIFVNDPDIIFLSSSVKGTLSSLELAHKIQFLNIPIFLVDKQQDEVDDIRYQNTPNLFFSNALSELENQNEFLNSILNRSSNGNAFDKNAGKENYLFLKKNNTHEKVFISDILFIKSEGNYCATTVENGEKYINRISLLDIAKLLNSTDFKKSHRSYLVNINKIDSINLSQASITIGEHEIPMSRNAKSYFLNSYKVIN